MKKSIFIIMITAIVVAGFIGVGITKTTYLRPSSGDLNFEEWKDCVEKCDKEFNRRSHNCHNSKGCRDDCRADHSECRDECTKKYGKEFKPVYTETIKIEVQRK